LDDPGGPGESTAASKAWAACLKKVFEVNPILCRNCGVEMEPVAAIIADAQLVRLLAHLRLPAEGINEDRGWHAT